MVDSRNETFLVQQVIKTFATDSNTFFSFSVATRYPSLGFVSFVRRWLTCISAVEFLNPAAGKVVSSRPAASVVFPLSNQKHVLVNALGQCMSVDSLSLDTHWFTIIKELCKYLSRMHFGVAPPLQTSSIVNSLTSLSLSRHIVEVPPGVALLTQLSVLKLRGYLIVIPSGLQCEACTRLVFHVVRDVRVKGKESLILGHHFPNVKALSYLVNRQPYKWPPQHYGHPTPVSECHELTDLQLHLDLQCWHTVFDSNPARHLRVRSPCLQFAILHADYCVYMEDFFLADFFTSFLPFMPSTSSSWLDLTPCFLYQGNVSLVGYSAWPLALQFARVWAYMWDPH